MALFICFGAFFCFSVADRKLCDISIITAYDNIANNMSVEMGLKFKLLLAVLLKLWASDHLSPASTACAKN